MLRRGLIIGASAALAGCGGQGPDVKVVANDVSIIAGGMQGVLTQLGGLSIPGLTPQLMGQVGGYVAELQSVAGLLANVSGATAAQPLVKQVEGYVNAIVGALAVLPLPPPISTALQAAAILLPVIEMAVGLVVGPQAGKPLLSVDQARLVLIRTAAGPPAK